MPHKKFLSVLLFLVLFLSACGNSTAEEEVEETLESVVETDPVESSTCPYTLPWNTTRPIQVSQGWGGNLSHQEGGEGEYSLDFDLDKGDEVEVSRSGVAIKVVDHFSACGGIELINNSNYIAILHTDGTVAYYGHIAQNSATIEEGDTVVRGQVIAEVGNTGWTNCHDKKNNPGGGYHLHFHIQMETEGFGQSIGGYCFADVEGGIPATGQWLQVEGPVSLPTTQVRPTQTAAPPTSTPLPAGSILGYWQGYVTTERGVKVIVAIDIKRECNFTEICATVYVEGVGQTYRFLEENSEWTCFGRVGESNFTQCVRFSQDGGLEYTWPAWGFNGILHREE